MIWLLLHTSLGSPQSYPNHLVSGVENTQHCEVPPGLPHQEILCSEKPCTRFHSSTLKSQTPQPKKTNNKEKTPHLWSFDGKEGHLGSPYYLLSSFLHWRHQTRRYLLANSHLPSSSYQVILLEICRRTQLQKNLSVLSLLETLNVGTGVTILPEMSFLGTA